MTRKSEGEEENRGVRRRKKEIKNTSGHLRGGLQRK